LLSREFGSHLREIALMEIEGVGHRLKGHVVGLQASHAGHRRGSGAAALEVRLTAEGAVERVVFDRSSDIWEGLTFVLHELTNIIK